MAKRLLRLPKELIPILIMIVLIPLVTNDFYLALIYIIIIAASLKIKRQKGDFLFLIFGFIAMTLSEAVFISTGVETFERNSLFGIMPIWLPFLWAYAFVVMRRSLKIIEA